MIAKYTARCADCDGRINAGDEIRYYPGNADCDVPAETVHAKCPPVETRARKTQNAGTDASWLFELDCCPQCGAFWAAHKAKGGLPAASPCCNAPWPNAGDADRVPEE